MRFKFNKDFYYLIGKSVVTPEEIKGNYVKLKGRWYCNCCRNEAYWDTDYGQQLFDYCPYCGKRMYDEPKEK